MAKVNPEQFRLFMTGTEWQSSMHSSTDGHDVDEVWKTKEAEARTPSDPNGPDYGPHGAGLYDAIKDHGYQHDQNDPPTILVNKKGPLHLTQFEGHHRVAAAAALERDTGKPTFIPTTYERHYR